MPMLHGDSTIRLKPECFHFVNHQAEARNKSEQVSRKESKGWRKIHKENLQKPLAYHLIFSTLENCFEFPSGWIILKMC